MSYPFDKRNRIIPASVIGFGAWKAYGALGPMMAGSAIHWPAATAAGVEVLCGIAIITDGFTLVADTLEWGAARLPEGRKGSAKWGSYWNVRKDLLSNGWGPYFGTFARGLFTKGRPIFAEYSAPIAIFGTSGSSKTVSLCLPNIMAIRESKLIPDFKSSLWMMTKEPLEARGEIVWVINIGGLHQDKLGKSASYNLLKILIDDFMRPHGLLDVESDANELATQLYVKGDKEEPFWSGGSYDIMEIAFIQTILVHGPKGNLGHVHQLITNRTSLLNEMKWVCGLLENDNGEPLPAMRLEDSPWAVNGIHDADEVERFIASYRGKATEIVDILQSHDKGNMATSFIRGAKNALKPFSPTSRSYHALSHSTFCFSDMKKGDQPVNVFLAMDASRMEQQSRIVAALEWAALTTWKRHENKHVPTYLIGEECTNAKIDQLPSLMTWGREYNICISLYIQSIGAFRTTYGKDAANTLLSETEAKIFLSGQRDIEMLELIEKLLGDQSIIAKNHSGKRDNFGVDGFGYQEDAKPLMRAEEIRRTDKAILFLRKNRPLLMDLPPIAAIHPWRTQIGINPFFGKPYLKKIKLRLGNRTGMFFQHWFKRRKI